MERPNSTKPPVVPPNANRGVHLRQTFVISLLLVSILPLAIVAFAMVLLVESDLTLVWLSLAGSALLASLGTALSIRLLMGRLIRAERARRNISAILSELQETSQQLERRTLQLQAASEVSKATSTILDKQALIQRVVDLIQERFAFYYVGLFLIDEQEAWADLAAGTGEVGLQQVETGHRLKLDGTSMIGWCIINNQARIADDVGEDRTHYVNRYLPDTRSEMALPLSSRGLVLGAISIQSKQVRAFSKNDISTLQSVADQVAIALQNSQLFGEVEEARTRYYALYNRTPAGHQTLALDGTILELNDIQRQMLGLPYGADHLSERPNFTDFLTDDSRQAFLSILPKLREGERIQNLELTYLLSGKPPLTVLMTASPTFDRAGNLLEVYASTQDITQLKQAELAREALLSETNVLSALGRKLLRVERTDEIFAACVNAIKVLQPSYGGAILIQNAWQGQTEMELVSVWHSESFAPPALEQGQTFAAADLGLKELLASNDTLLSKQGDQDPRFSQPFRQFISDLRFTAVLGCPIWNRSDVIGALLIGQSDSASFANNDIRHIERVAWLLSVSLENLALFEETQHRLSQLEAAAEVSKSTTSEIQLAVLLPRTVALVQEVFGYHRVSIFLVDDYGERAVLQASTGSAGRELLQENYHVPLEAQHIVGAAIIENKAKIVADPNQTMSKSQHPLLTDIDSEVVIPLVVREVVIGALDVQNTRKKLFNPSDAIVLQTIADQLANAIYVARLFEREQEAREEIQTLHRHYLQREWQSYLTQESNQEKLSVSLTREDSQISNKDWLVEFADSVADKPVVSTHTIPSPESSSDENLAVLAGPLMLRGQVIGSLGVADTGDREWSAEEIDIIRAVSAQATLAIENARLVEETRRHAIQLQTSATISQAITSLLDETRIAGSSVKLIQSKFNLSRVHLTLIESGSGPWQTRVYESFINSDEEATNFKSLTLSQDSLAGQALVTQSVVVVQGDDTASLKPFEAESTPSNSAVAIPLMVRQTLLGVLTVYSDAAHAFNRNQVTVLGLLAAQIAISIENARAYQEQQFIADKLREVDKLKTQFLANMSHELRTPLNSIIGFSRVILKGIDGPLTEMQKHDLTSIYQSGQHLLGLINDILDLAKIEAGKLELLFAEVQLEPLIRGVATTAIGLVKDKSITIKQNIAPDLPVIIGDELKVRQILLNLVSNAAKFTESGTITIRANHEAGQVTLQVVDTGMGIPPENLKTIFDEFTQVDASTTRKVSGTGLGLSITKRYVELHHGEIFVESEPNSGSTFTVILPVTQPDTNGHFNPITTEAAQQIMTTTDQPKSLILVIDQEKAIEQIYKPFLSERYEIAGLEGNQDIIALAGTLKPHFILFDVVVPAADGWAIIQGLKEDHRTAHIPIIVCSMVRDEHRLKSQAIFSYLPKPFTRDELLEALEEVDRLHQAGRRVLIIDDNADDILLSRRILEARECQVIEASSGLEGVEIINQIFPELIILDLTMPGILDGFGVMKALKERPETAAIPIIVITARDLTPDEREQINQQATALLTKGSFSDLDLLQYVDAIFDAVPIPS